MVDELNRSNTNVELEDKNIRSDSKIKRSVKFEDDDKLVSAVFEFPGPWTNVERLNPYELAGAYKLKCDMEGLEPLYTVLAQLQTINMKTSEARHICFNLKGIQLNESHVEVLEEIFKRVQFEHLNLENTNLTDKTVGALCDMIEFYDSCTELSLARNSKITGVGWTCVARIVRKLPCLRWLDLRDAKLNEADILRFSDSFRSQSFLYRTPYKAKRCSQQVASVESQVDGNSENLARSGLSSSSPLSPSSFRTTSSGLQGLHLGGTLTGGRELSHLLNSVRLSSICDLRLSDNQLDPSAAASLVPLLRYGATLRYLDLSRNQLQDDGCKTIANALASTAFPGLPSESANCGLRRLDLSDNHLTEASMGALGVALSNCQHLVCLQLSDNIGLGCQGLLNLHFGLLRCRWLRRLGLANCNIACVGMVSLAEVLIDRPRRLRVIDVTNNHIGTAGVLAINRCFRCINEPIRIKGIEAKSLAAAEIVNHRSTDRTSQTSIVDSLFMETLRTLNSLLQENLHRFPASNKNTKPRYSEMHCPQSSMSVDPRYFWGDSSDEDEEDTGTN